MLKREYSVNVFLDTHMYTNVLTFTLITETALNIQPNKITNLLLFDKKKHTKLESYTKKKVLPISLYLTMNQIDWCT